jgi:hypothetical protein
MEQLAFPEYFICDCKDNGIDDNMIDRGVILRKTSTEPDKVKMICRTFPYTEEFFTSDEEKIKEKVQQGDWKYYPSYEGTIIRVVYDPEFNVQLVSTHKKIDAFQSRWGSEESFGQLFKRSIEEFYKNNNKNDNMDVENIWKQFLSSLPKSHHHTFLLCSNLDTKIVANRDNEVFYVGSFDVNTNEYKGIVYDVADKCQIFCNSIAEIQWFEQPENMLESILEYVEKLNPLNQQGVLAVRQDKFEMFKIVNDVYNSLSELRNNNPNLNIRYLELYKSSSHMLNDFLFFFDNKFHEFQTTGEMYDDTIKYIYNVALSRYERGQYVKTTPFFHNFIKMFENRAKTEGLTYEYVFQKMGEQTTETLYNLMQSYVRLITTGM